MITIKSFIELFIYSSRCLFNIKQDEDNPRRSHKDPWLFYNCTQNTILQEIPDAIVVRADFDYDMFVGRGIFTLTIE